MLNPRSFCFASFSALALVLRTQAALATTLYVSPTGTGDGSSASSPMSLATANTNAAAGDIVILAGGTYTTGIAPANSGKAEAWITFKAADGALPIIEGTETGGGSDTNEYLAIDGVAARHNTKMGFSNHYIDYCGGSTQAGGSSVSNGHFKYTNVIAEGSGISGIATFCAREIVIQNAIIAHNGLGESWSSGINLYGTIGGPTVNTIRGVVSFENLDISGQKSDGSGFILDVGTKGALFQNNIAFRNGGSCFRITNSNNAQLINNTCWNNAQYDTQYADEIFFSTGGDSSGAVIRNNIIVPHSGKSAIGGSSGSVAKDSTVALSGGAATPFFKSSTGALDLRLADSAKDEIDKGSTNGAPEADIGFDPKCIKEGKSSPSDYPVCTGTEGTKNSCSSKATWFQYKIDYDYIASIGGIRSCFQPGARDGKPDIGAYEHGTEITHGTGGAGGTDGGGMGTAGSAIDGGLDGGSGGSSSTGSTSSGKGGATSTGSGGATSTGSGGATSTGSAGVLANGGGGSSAGASSTQSAGALSNGGGGNGSTVGANATGKGGAAGGTGSEAKGGSAGDEIPGGSDNGCGCRIGGAEHGPTQTASIFGLAVALMGLRLRRRARG